MSSVCKFYNLEKMDGQSILRRISEMVNREHRFYDLAGTKDSNDYILTIGLDVYYCIKNHCLKNHIIDNPPIYESGIICSPYMYDQLEFEVLTPDVFSPWIVVLRKKSEPFNLRSKMLRDSTHNLHSNMLKSFEKLKNAKAAMNSVYGLNLHSKMLEYAANDIATTRTLYNKMYNFEQKHIENVIFNDPATIVFWNDRTKTVVKVADGETFDPSKGLAMAIAKKYFGNDSSYYKVLHKWLSKDKTVDNKTPEYKRNRHIKNVIFNDPATIVFWNDGTKTVVKVQNEKFDPEKGLAMAISKKCFGNKGSYYNVFRKWLVKQMEEARLCSECKYFSLSTAVDPCASCFIDGDSPNWVSANKSRH